MVRGILLLFLSLNTLFSVTAQAQLSSSLELEAQDPSKQSRFQAITMLSSESNFQDSDSPDARATTSVIVVPTYVLDEFNTIGATMAYIQDHDDEQKSSVNDIKVYIKRKPITLVKNSTLNLVNYFSAYLPTNEDSRDIGTFRGAVEYDPRVAFTILPRSLNLPVTYKLSLKKNFHEFTLSEKGTPNISYSVSNSVNVEKALFNSPFSLGVDLGMLNAWTYRDVTRSQFSASQYIGYTINDNLIIQAGHSNTDSVYKTDGKSNNIEVFDRVSSMYYATMILIF